MPNLAPFRSDFALNEPVEFGVEVVEALGEEFGFFLEGGDEALEGADAFVDLFAGGGGSTMIGFGFALEIGDEVVEADTEVGKIFLGGEFFVERGNGLRGAEVGLPEVEGMLESDDAGGGDDPVLVILGGAGFGGIHGGSALVLSDLVLSVVKAAWDIELGGGEGRGAWGRSKGAKEQREGGQNV